MSTVQEATFDYHPYKLHRLVNNIFLLFQLKRSEMSQQLFKRNLIFLDTCELENSSWITILIFTFRETHGRGREFNLNWILFLLKLLGKKIQTKINSFPFFFLFSEKKIQTELYFLPFFWISSITGFSFSISPFTLFHFMFSPSIFFLF